MCNFYTNRGFAHRNHQLCNSHRHLPLQPHTMTTEYEKLQQAVFARLTTSKSVKSIAQRTIVSLNRLKFYVWQWKSVHGTDKTQKAQKVKVSVNPVGSSTVPTPKEEECVLEVVNHFIERCMPLARGEMLYSVQDFVRLLSASRQQDMTNKDGRLYDIWLRQFLRRHPELEVSKPHEMEGRRVTDLATENVGIHIARFKTRINGYGIERRNKV